MFKNPPVRSLTKTIQSCDSELQRKRSEEARQLISQRSTNQARSVFERNSSMGQMNFRKPSQTSAPTIPEKSVLQSVSTAPPSSKATVPSSREAFKAETRSPEQKKDTPDSHQKLPSNTISISHSNNGHQNNAIDNTKHQDNHAMANAKVNSTESKVSNQQSKEVEEQANMVNANEVNTEDIVVPPPESFGNDDNHRALAAAALQVGVLKYVFIEFYSTSFLRLFV